MFRALLPLVLGAVLGAVAVHVSERVGSSPKSGVAADTATGELSRAAQARSNEAGESSTVDEPAAGTSTVTAIDAITARAAAEPDALLEELPALSPSGRQREAALAILAALGYGDAAITRVAAMLPEADRMSFRIDALAARAESDPVSAVLGALAFDISEARRLAIARVAAAAGGVDPMRALTQASLIGDRELSAMYLASVAGAWADLDAPAALAWLETAVPSELPATVAADALEAIAANDEDLLLANLDRMSPALRPVAREVAVLALAERDLQAALDEVESLVPGRDRSSLEGKVAERYGLENPEAAVAWAMSLQDPQSAVEGALRGAATVDYDAAADLLMQVLETETISPTSVLMDSGAGDFSQIADQLIESNLPGLEAKLSAMIVRWPQVDAEAALAWALPNIDRLGGRSLGRLMLDGGREAPDVAMAAVSRVPLDLRDEWIAGVAGGVAAADADRALTFLEQYRGEAGYDRGLANVVDSMTASDPVAAARLVERTGAQAAGRVAWAWAQQDPTAAASWVAGLEDPNLYRDAVVNLAGNWSRTNPDAAIEWMLGLPESSARDFALQTSIPASAAATGSLDGRVLDAIGDDRMRERAAMSAIVVIARSNADEARRLVEQHIETSSVQEEALRRIAEQRGGTDIVSIISSSVDVPR